LEESKTNHRRPEGSAQRRTILFVFLLDAASLIRSQRVGGDSRMNAKDPVPYETVVGKLGRRKDR
jgi:hypothetical protein